MNARAQVTLDRIKKLIKEIFLMIDCFPRKTASFTIAKQIMDLVTSIGANFVEAQSSRSTKEFVSIMAVVLREAKETLFWLEIVSDLKLTCPDKIDRIYQECGELVKIFSATVITTSRSLK